jgi:ABC-2 type transport system ATP-binding protein/lipopolysaccharide transport system ATP-binding protein
MTVQSMAQATDAVSHDRMPTARASGASARIVADCIGVEFPVASPRALSLRNAALDQMQWIGGRVIDRGSHIRKVRALDGVSFRLSDGDRLGLVGANGSGKTTLIRVLAGIYAPTAGQLTVEGTRVPLADISTGTDDESTGYENIRLRGLLLGLSLEEIERKAAEIAAFSELGDYLHLPVRTYSSGMVLRLMFAIATSIEGNIVLMDEWIAVGDHEFRRKANERLRSIAARAGILVIASHDPGILRELCTLGLRLESGRAKQFGPIEEVLAGQA